MIPMKELTKKLKASGIDVSKIDLEAAIKYYEESRKQECADTLKTMDNKQLKIPDKEIREEINRARKKKPRVFLEK
jgi:S-adenosylmethionine:tRNA-ribosyltransferase-isomerase (queuine synthetase)